MVFKLVFGMIRNVFYLLFNPPAWESMLKRLEIPEDFTLLKVGWADLKNHAGIRFLCIQTLLVVPVFAGLISVVIVAIQQATAWPVLVFSFLLAFGYAFTNALTTSVLIGIGAAQVYALSIGIGMGALGIDPTNIYFSYAIPAGLVGRVLLNFSDSEKKTNRFRKNALSFLSGLIIVIVLIAGWAFVFSGVVIKGEFTRFAKNFLSISEYALLALTSTFVVSLVLFAAIFIRSSEWRMGFFRKLYWALGLGCICGFSTSVLITNPPMTALGAFLAGMGGGITFAILFSLPWVIFNRTNLDMMVIVAAAFMVGVGWVSIGKYLVPGFVIDPYYLMMAAVYVLAGLTSFAWIPIVTYPLLELFNLLLWVIDIRDPMLRFRFFRYHAAFWFPSAPLPWLNLDHHLVKYYERNPSAAHKMMVTLAQTNQRWAVRNALFSIAYDELLACQSLEDMAQLSPLPLQIPDELLTLNNQFLRLAGDIKTALVYQNPFHLRAALARVRDEMVAIERSLMMSSNKQFFRFLAVCGHWSAIIEQSLQDLSNQSRLQEEIYNPYICGIPLNEKQEIFVGRTDVFERIEQLILNEQRPPILLYGQRRMGKTSLLLNLGRILPSAMVPLYLDCQALVGVQNFAELFYRMVQQMRSSAVRNRDLVLPEIDLVSLKESPFLVFMEWVIDVEIYLANQKKMMLWLLDEFETLDDWAEQRALNIQELLSLIRHIVQHHANIKVLFSGAHHLSELEDWSSSLVNTHVIKLGCLTTEETRQLIQYPVKNFNLTYPAEALDWMIKLTGGHPHLIQLLCYELILLKNEQPVKQRCQISLHDLEEACRLATLSGEFFFIDILKNQIRQEMQQPLIYLAKNTKNDSVLSYDQWKNGASGDVDSTIILASRRDIIKRTHNDEYGFQIEWIRRWFENRTD